MINDYDKGVIKTLHKVFVYLCVLFCLSGFVALFVYLIGNVINLSDKALLLSIRFCGISASISLLMIIILIPLFILARIIGEKKFGYLIVVFLVAIFSFSQVVFSAILVSAFSGYSV